MKNDRYNELMNWDNKMINPKPKLTAGEITLGWHWCPDWDFLLVGPGMEGEQAACNCFCD